MNDTLINEFRKKLRSGPVFGPFMKTCDPAFTEAAGYAGCDFAILDMEHGPISIENMQNNVRAAQIAGMLPIIRVETLSETAISKALDVGAAGVQIPQITSAEDAREAVRAARFFPNGERGVCRFVRAAHYSALPGKEYFKSANNALIIIQLEGQKAVAALDKILEVEGIDIIFIGPYDLSQSLGIPGQTTHPLVVNQMKEMTERAQKKGITIGTFTDSTETMELWMNAGVQYLSYSVDVGIFCDACKSIKSRFNDIAADKPHTRKNN